MKTAMDSSITIAELYDACFPGDTPVLIENITKSPYYCINIENLRVGAKVLSRDEITGEMAYKRVIKFYENGYRATCLIHVSGPIIDEWFGGHMLIEATSEHPFWVQGKGWTPVRELRPEDEFLTDDGHPVRVDRVEIDSTRATVFNLEVEDFNTYFVSTGIWVHNCNNSLKPA